MLTADLIKQFQNGKSLDVSKVFSTDLYTGNGSTQTITNGIDLTNKGGLVWTKNRSDGAASHFWVDSERGGKYLSADRTAGEVTTNLIALNADGHTVGDGSSIFVNSVSDNFAAWTFRKAPRFFDVVTYTGDGTGARTIAHNLGIEPGMIAVKRRDSSGAWVTYHRGNTAAPEAAYLYLESTQATADFGPHWNDTAPTDSVFTVGSGGNVNTSGATYVAYLFAHDTAANGVIQCGSYTGNGSTTGPTVSLGWDPQWLLIKRTNDLGGWLIFDAARGMVSGIDPLLVANSSAAEGTAADYLEVSATGFQPRTNNSTINASGGTYIYTAIRAEGA